ncbi:K02A2.6-like [Cordylochernes scorpioides]|uniref:RNA-directed DNA polymerase n=1 Tax=Cordylochernes scorpioides TaxID=51811 RepID=A0ABY6KDW7_9ARAC|nr:K02A2.6-like [Cordylochernes scorpioides]
MGRSMPTVGSLSGDVSQSGWMVGSLSGDVPQSGWYVGSLSGDVPQSGWDVGSLSGDVPQSGWYVSSLSGTSPSRGGMSAHCRGTSPSLGGMSAHCRGTSPSRGGMSAHCRGRPPVGVVCRLTVGGRPPVGVVCRLTVGDVPQSGWYVGSLSGDVPQSGWYVGSLSGDVPQSGWYVGSLSGDVPQSGWYVGSLSGDVPQSGWYVGSLSGDVPQSGWDVGSLSGTSPSRGGMSAHCRGTSPSRGGMSAHCRGTSPSRGGMSAHCRGTSPSRGGMSAHCRGTSPSRGGMSAHCRGTSPSRGGMSAHCRGTSPSRGGMSAQCRGTSPSRGGMSAQCRGTSPSRGGMSAHCRGTSPSRGGMSAQCRGTSPSRGGMSAHCRGTSPSLGGMSAHCRGTSPSRGGMSAHCRGTSPSRGGMSAHCRGKSPSRGGMSAHCRGKSPSRGGMSAHCRGTSPSRGGMSAHCRGTSPSRGGMSAHCRGTSPSRGGMSAHCRGTSPSRGGMSAHCRGTSPSRGGMSAHCRGTSPSRGGMSAHCRGTSPSRGGMSAHCRGTSPSRGGMSAHCRGTSPSRGGMSAHCRGTSPSRGGMSAQCRGTSPSRGGAHALSSCNLFSELPESERVNFVSSAKLCFRCLKQNHLAKNCYCKNICQICKKRHHTLIHQETKVQEVDEGKFECGKDIKNTTCLLSNEKYFSNVMLTTARIKIKDNNDVPQTCRALIDSGSQANFISGQCRKRLGLEYVTLHSQISGISGHFASHSYRLVEFEFTPHFKSDELFKVNALVLDKLTNNLPTLTCPKSNLAHLKTMPLADPDYNISAPIDILIGAELAMTLFTGESVIGDVEQLTGLLSGRVSSKGSSRSIRNIIQSHHACLETQNIVEKFWKLESIPDVTSISKDENESEIHFVETHGRDSTGRYVVQLPFRNDCQLGDSRSNAIKRLCSLERSLIPRPEVYDQYRSFIKEYLELGHMSLVPKEDIIKGRYYLPVIKEKSCTTKLRVVFDASAKTDSESFDPKNPEKWITYFERMIFFFLANDIVKLERRKAIFLTLIGAETYALARSLASPKELSFVEYDDLIKLVTDHFCPKPNIIVKRFLFNKRNQGDESVSAYIAELRKLSEDCEFVDLEDRLRDKLVCGLRNESLVKRLLSEKDLTFEKAMNLAICDESASADASVLQEKITEVNMMKKASKAEPPKFKSGKVHFKEFKKMNNKIICIRCKGNHMPNECKFRNAKCFKCGKIGHVQKACLTNVGKSGNLYRANSNPTLCCLRREEIELRKLKELEEQGVIEPVKFTKWASPIVTVLKNDGSIRICHDYKSTVNLYSNPDKYPLPTIPQLLDKLRGGKLFTKVDMAQAYQQLKVDEESSEILAINTHRGLYKMKRLPFGLNSAVGTFQRFMDTLLSGIDGVAVYLDDVLIAGSNCEDLKKKTEKVLLRFKEAGLRLKRDKCKFFVSEIEFLGMKIDNKGIHPSEEKLRAIKDARPPCNKKELKSFLGLLNYYERFLKNKSTVVEPIHRLLDSNSPWKWRREYQRSFDKAKDLISSESVLALFDDNLPILINCDASEYGIGAVLSQIHHGVERPVMFASRTLNKTERRYAVIDKEALALECSTQKKPIPQVLSPRMLRWCLTLAAYTYSIEYKPGKVNCNVDALSRLPLNECPSVVPNPSEVFFIESEHAAINSSEVAKLTSKDPILSKVKFWAMNGWPERRVDDKFKDFVSKSSEISVHKDCLLWGSRVIIPERLRKDILNLLHDTHIGIVGTKALARGLCWWPKMDGDIERMISSCAVCLSYSHDPPKTDVYPWIWPSRPWSRLHIDHAGPFQGKLFLVVVDAYSKWIEAKIVSTTSTETTINSLKEIFATHGLPDVIVSDNGTSFTSELFRTFLKRNGVRHILCAPYHAASNGQVEIAIQTLKNLLRKNSSGNWTTRLSRSLLSMRIAINSTTQKSPAQLLMNRNLKSLLNKFHPESVSEGRIRQEDGFIRNWKPHRVVNEGQAIIARGYHGPRWLPGVVQEKTGPVSIKVETDDGAILNRHLDQVRGCGESEALASTSSTPQESTNIEDPQAAQEIDPAGEASSPILRSTRAIHIELISSLTTDALISTIRRFIARRGKPATIHSDNATNFVGAHKIIGKLCHNASKVLTNSKGIQWKFIPPSAPHFGGIWEAGVKSMKYHLRRTMGSALLNFEELTTLLAQIEACLNSRPLCPLSEDPEDLQALTPGHFLIGGSLTVLPDEDGIIAMSLPNRWQLIQKSMNHFWTRWSQEYVSQLQQRSKWCKPQPNIKEGSLVLIKNEQQPPLAWKIGRISKVFPGDDARIRVVEVKTANGTYRRPIVKLFACFMRTRSGLFYEMANADQKPLEAPTVEAGVTTSGDAGFDPIPFNPSLNIRKYAGDEDPRQWITSLEEVGFLYRWADYIITRYAAMNLVGPAKTWYEFHKIRGVGGFKLESAPVPVNQGMSKIGAITEMDSKSRINVNVDKIGILEALVDTGADFSIVDLRTALETGVRIETYNGNCIGPDGKRLNILGSISMDIKIDEKSLNHRFVVLESNMRSLIIGRDLLRRLNAKINCKRDILEYDIVTECQDSNEAPRKIINQQDEVVPQLCVKLVRVTVKANDGEYVVEPNEKLTLTNGLRIARCLITNQTLGYASPPTMVNYIEDDEEDKVTEIQINEDLTLSQKNELRQVLSKYSDLFSSKLGKTNLAKHRIDTENAKPIKHKPHRVSPKERDIIKEQIQDMLQEGVIRASSSPWAFPVILVRKRDGNWRFCVDYRKLNSITVKDVYPIPRIDDVMDTLQGSRYFTAIDLRSGYWQVEIEEQDKKKTAITTSHGLYEFNVMPFGLCNAQATFERIMDNVLKNIKWKFCLCYLDDVVIYSPDFTTHLGRIEAVLKCFRETNLRLNGKKCRFGFEEIEILGHVTSKHGIKPADHNVKAIRDIPRPSKTKEIHSFMGLCSYYRKFIKNFSRIADPLFKLTRKDSPFIWSESQEEAFITLKSLLTNPPILSHFDPEAPTQIHTDASNIGLGATLVQTINGQEKVISYISRSLSKPERNYSTTEKECLALVWSMSKLRPYLYGKRFKVMTDHHALCWLRNLRDPTDGLSRGPLPETDFDDNYDSLFFNPVIEDSDEYIENIKRCLGDTEGKRSIVENFNEENGCLYKRNPRPEGRAWLLVVLRVRRKDILKEHHNHMICGHLGVTRTMHRLKDKYFWPSMLKDVVEYVRTCHLCQSRKGSNQLPAGLLHPIPAANYPFERVGIDILGPLSSTKNRKKWMIVLTDYYTKYAETKAVIDATAKEVAKFLTENVILKHGAPRYLISDRGSQFTRNLVKEITKICQIQHCLTTSYHPQTNGLTERLNRTLINMISMYVNVDQRNWDEILLFKTHAYNTTIQETTKYSPFFLLYGREPVSILDDTNIFIEPDSEDYDEYVSKLMEKIVRTRDIVKVNTERSQEKMINYYNQKHRQTGYEPGDLVALWTPIRKPGKYEKLLRRYFGPYIVLKKISDVNYSIVPEDNPGNRTQPTTVHISRIKPYFARMEDGHEDATISEEGEVSHSA